MTRKPAPAERAQTDPSAQQTKASVHEAIGKLIGDEAEEARGAAKKRAAEAATNDKPPRS